MTMPNSVQINYEFTDEGLHCRHEYGNNDEARRKCPRAHYFVVAGRARNGLKRKLALLKTIHDYTSEVRIYFSAIRLISIVGLLLVDLEETSQKATFNRTVITLICSKHDDKFPRAR